MFSNFNNFTYSSKYNFPKNECVIQNEREPDVFDSDKIYQVLYIDIRFPNDKMLAFARPYIYKDKNECISFGWSSATSSEIFGNVENSCQFWDEFVVGFIPVNEDIVEEDRKMFEKYKETIDEYYDKWIN